MFFDVFCVECGLEGMGGLMFPNIDMDFMGGRSPSEARVGFWGWGRGVPVAPTSFTKPSFMIDKLLCGRSSSGKPEL